MQKIFRARGSIIANKRQDQLTPGISKIIGHLRKRQVFDGKNLWDFNRKAMKPWPFKWR